jgi:predicted dehydrogenase
MPLKNQYMKQQHTPRRKFLSDLSLAFGGTVILSSFGRCQSKTSPASTSSANGGKLGIALVGLGGYSSGQLAPALQETQNCYLAGIVTGTPGKEKEWAEKYNIPQKNIYNYKTFDSIADNKDIDIVYVVLPVGMHKEYTIRAANAGKHVICEKPMAVNAADCQEMIDACKKANRLLSIGYRLHFEPFNMEAMRIGQQKVYGKILTINADNGFTWGNDMSSWRLNKALAGGGGLMDMGVYAIQAARYTTSEEPAHVTAREEKLRPDVFKEVDETVYFDLDFDSGTKAKCMSSYNKNVSRLRADAERGWFEIAPAFYYSGQVGNTSNGPMNFDNNFVEQVAQMDDFALCVQQNKPSKVSGEEGLKDMRVVDAIYRSIASGKKEKIV